jgi:iron(III) transport system ATP-binding protein
VDELLGTEYQKQIKITVPKSGWEAAMSSVRFEAVTKRFQDVIGVANLNLEIRNGEFFTLLGPSGCGKTTTLRMIAGFTFPSEGRIFLGEREITSVPPHKRNTGMVFQNYALFPHMTVMENVAFGLTVRKLSKPERTKRVKDILQRVRLEGFEDRKISELSGGQQQRVALARALVIRPSILLLDEPLSNLDARLREEMRSEILALHRSFGITTVYVTHDQTEALTMSDRIAVFQRGTCQQVGTPEEIYQSPKNAFVASFVGETNLLPATVLKREGDSVLVCAASALFEVPVTAVEGEAAAGETMWLSIRPEAVEIVTGPGSNTISVTTELIQFMGFSIHCTAKAEDGTRLRSLILNHRFQGMKEGEALFFHFPAERLRLFAQRGEEE